MYLINTSFHAGHTVAGKVIEDVRSRLKPLMEQSGLFSNMMMAEILVEVDPDCKSFTLQGITADLDKAMEWMQETAGDFFSGLHRDYAGNVVFFTTPMNIIQ